MALEELSSFAPAAPTRLNELPLSLALLFTPPSPIMGAVAVGLRTSEKHGEGLLGFNIAFSDQCTDEIEPLNECWIGIIRLFGCRFQTLTLSGAH